MIYYNYRFDWNFIWIAWKTNLIGIPASLIPSVKQKLFAINFPIIVEDGTDSKDRNEFNQGKIDCL